jgi:hypothetical protein
MTKMPYIVTALLFASISVAQAADTTDTAKQPVAQGAASIDKNLSANPDNKGLKNASKHLEASEAKVAEKRAEAGAKRKDAKHKKDKEELHEHMDKSDHDKHEHHEKMERGEKMDRPGK